MQQSSKIERVAGTALVLRGDDIDTDRVIPARFLKAITFQGLERHLFEDDRQQAAARGEVHAFDDAGRRRARVLLVNANFGCGSSREHAPQALARWGIQAVVGESFAEIFFTNCLAIGIACVHADGPDLVRLMDIADAAPDAEFIVDLDTQRVSVADVMVNVSVPEAARHALMSGAWDGTGLLLENYDEVERVAAKLPYRFDAGEGAGGAGFSRP